MAQRPRRATTDGDIVIDDQPPVNSSDGSLSEPAPGRRPGRRKKQRRQSHGSAWHWTQTDCWYYTLPGTKKRVALYDATGDRVRGKENKEAARLALARVKLTREGELAPQPLASGEWVVAKVCSEYVQYCDRGVAAGTVSPGHRENTGWVLNDFCRYCGALRVPQLLKRHVQAWIESHPTWKSPATHRSVIAIVLAAFNHARSNFDVPNPLSGLKKPSSRPRLWSLTAEEEQKIYTAAGDAFGDFLFAAVHTGLRPYCELAKLTADDVEELPRGMMWRVYSSKTKKTRKIPVRTEVAELTRRLVKTAPAGSGRPLFRTKTGVAWQKVHGVVRFLELKRKLGWDKDPVRGRYSTYVCRHTFAHRMLSGYWNGGAGCTIETLAELIGDTPTVAFAHYGREWGQHFQDPLWSAIGLAANSKATPTSKPHERPTGTRPRSTSKAKRELFRTGTP